MGTGARSADGKQLGVSSPRFPPVDRNPIPRQRADRVPLLERRSGANAKAAVGRLLVCLPPWQASWLLSPKRIPWRGYDSDHRYASAPVGSGQVRPTLAV